MELVHIAQGWFNFIKGSPETKQMMSARLSVCDGCPHKVQISTVGEKIVKAINQDASLYVCGLCGCPLAGLTASPHAKCKAGKWGPWEKTTSYYE